MPSKGRGCSEGTVMSGMWEGAGQGANVSQLLRWAEKAQRCCTKSCISASVQTSRFDFFQHNLLHFTCAGTEKATFSKTQEEKFFCKFWDREEPRGHLVSLFQNSLFVDTGRPMCQNTLWRNTNVSEDRFSLNLSGFGYLATVCSTKGTFHKNEPHCQRANKALSDQLLFYTINRSRCSYKFHTC